MMIEDPEVNPTEKSPKTASRHAPLEKYCIVPYFYRLFKNHSQNAMLLMVCYSILWETIKCPEILPRMHCFIQYITVLRGNGMLLSEFHRILTAFC